MAGLDFVSNVAESISDIFKSALGIIDELHTSEEEKAKAKSIILQAQNTVLSRILDFQSKMAEYQSKVVISETTGHSWLQRNWRPILMLTFTFIIAWNYIISPIFGLKAAEIPGDMWALMKIGMGGYIVGRSFEKTAPYITGLIKGGKKE